MKLYVRGTGKLQERNYVEAVTDLTRAVKLLVDQRHRADATLHVLQGVVLEQASALLQDDRDGTISRLEQLDLNLATGS